MPISYPQIYWPILLQAGIAVAIAGGALAATSVLGHRVPNKVKDLPYECGITPTGDARGRFTVKFYLVGMLFILFDVEVVFLFPWAVVFRDLKMAGFISMAVYMVLILAGFFFVWKKGVLDWGRPERE
ncbi:MAG: NADH-quinone oxidoreductase subunit A [Acidobacteria bacterium]|nr:NADH-quinone oxidoreductase subunit A [Acidobacteriota bacterium]